MANKKYRVHRLDVKGEAAHTRLEQFLNELDGEVVSILSDIKKGSLAQIYGATAKVDFLLIVERI